MLQLLHIPKQVWGKRDCNPAAEKHLILDMITGNLTPSELSCFTFCSWVLVLLLPLPELSTLLQADVPAPQVAAATAKLGPVPHADL